MVSHEWLFVNWFGEKCINNKHGSKTNEAYANAIDFQ